jgi:hypothetical protein
VLTEAGVLTLAGETYFRRFPHLRTGRPQRRFAPTRVSRRTSATTRKQRAPGSGAGRAHV